MANKTKKIIISVLAILALSVVTVGALAAANIVDIRYFAFWEKSISLQQDQTVVAIVNGERIYRSSILFQKEYIALSVENGLKQIETLPISEEEKKEYRERENKRLAQTEDEILSDLISKKVMTQEAKRLKLTVSIEEARQFVKEGYEVVKKAASEKDADQAAISNYNFVKSYMEAYNLTEEEYFNRAAETQQIAMTRDKLYAHFAATAKNKDQAYVNAEFEQYVNELVDKSDIKISMK